MKIKYTVSLYQGMGLSLFWWAFLVIIYII